MVFDGNYQYQYDAENHLTMVIPANGTFGDCSTATACYFYNAEGQRIAKYMNGGGSGTIFYVYGSDGEVVSDTDQNQNCFRNIKPLRFQSRSFNQLRRSRQRGFRNMGYLHLLVRKSAITPSRRVSTSGFRTILAELPRSPFLDSDAKG